MGIDSTALLTACVMSAPGSLAIAKLVYPEVRFRRIEVIQSDFGTSGVSFMTRLELTDSV